MIKTPTIFLKNEWGRICCEGYNVVGFNKFGKKSAEEIASRISDGEECWICLKATFVKEVKTEGLKGCFISLAKIKDTKTTLPTLENISPDAASKGYRYKENGDFKWPYCLKVTEICHAELPYEKFNEILSAPRYQGQNMRNIALELLPEESKKVKEFFEKRNFKWETIK